MAALLANLQTAFYMADRLQIYFEYYTELPSIPTTLNFEDALVYSYGILLDFLARAVRTLQQDTPTRAVKSFLKLEEYKIFEDKCNKAGERADSAARNCDRDLTREDRQKAQELRHCLKDALEKLKSLQEIKTSLSDLHNDIVISRLPIAKGAAYDSYDEEQNDYCLAGTRVRLLQDITEWAEDLNRKHIFWLNGMAGTGKSTVSRSVAKILQSQGRLGATFFFKRGEADRSNASKLFTTIAGQLGQNVPGIRSLLVDALNEHSNLPQKTLREQFENLILAPISNSSITATFTIIIDAIDECDRVSDMQTVISLFRRLTQVRASISLRIFITSRPEPDIRLSFSEISKGAFDDIILHEIARKDIEHDIDLYFKHQFQQLRERRSRLLPQYPLPPDWPGLETHNTLVQRAVPLFIFASTICRFITDRPDTSENRLTRVLQHKGTSKLSQTYMPILQQLADERDPDQEPDIQDFLSVVGPIVTFADPLSVMSISKLLKIPAKDVSQRLLRLHSVLNVPEDPSLPVRLLHLSFRDFLVDPDRRETSVFWIDEQRSHEKLAEKCLEHLSEPGRLRRDICSQTSFGVLKNEVSDECVIEAIPTETAYACRHWTYHAQKAGQFLIDNSTVYRFLEAHLLHWMEALSWLGSLSSIVACIESLRSLTDVS